MFSEQKNESRLHEGWTHAEKKKLCIVKNMSKDGKLLSKCKACSTGRKYRVDFDATAHLRRQHFKKSKNPKIELPSILGDYIEEILAEGEDSQRRKGRVRQANQQCIINRLFGRCGEPPMS
jgi:hypothetical protein